MFPVFPVAGNDRIQAGCTVGSAKNKMTFDEITVAHRCLCFSAPGCIARAAKQLRICRRQLYRLVTRHNLQGLTKRHPGGAPMQGNRAWREMDNGCGA